jgi:hypothetical protein
MRPFPARSFTATITQTASLLFTNFRFFILLLRRKNEKAYSPCTQNSLFMRLITW